MTGGHVPTKGKGKRSGPPNEGSSGKRPDSPVSQKGESQSCETCRFFGDQNKVTIGMLGVEEHVFGCCRRRAPVRHADGDSYFPATAADNWCGEYQIPPEILSQAFLEARCDVMGHLWNPTGECAVCGVDAAATLRKLDPLAGRDVDDNTHCPKSPHHCHEFNPTGQCNYCGAMAKGFDDTFTAADAKPPEPVGGNRSCVDGLPDVCKSGVHEYLEGGGATSCIFCGHVPDD